MATRHDDVVLDDDYDEEADSDFDANQAADEAGASSSEGDDNAESGVKTRKTQPPKTERGSALEVDSGDEAVINFHKSRRKRKADQVDDEAGKNNNDEGWQAKTRSMRVREKEERKQSKLASAKQSTIDVDEIWEEMNKPGFQSTWLPKSAAEVTEESAEPAPETEEEIISIKRTYKFAGEVHTEERVVPKNSRDAQLWLAEQAIKGSSLSNEKARDSKIRRPLRKYSRFDPNLNNLEAFKKRWEKENNPDGVNGPKINTVDKSKMDWAQHVDQAGLQDELDEHAKSRQNFLTRQDFLNQSEQKKEALASEARRKG